MNKTAKIMVTDDSAFMRKVLIDILREAGFTDFIEASNGKEALEKFQTEKPDLIMLDIIMPEMDGLELLKRIPKNANILVVSAIGQDAIIDEAKELGAKDYVTKPFDKEDVLKKTRAILKI